MFSFDLSFVSANDYENGNDDGNDEITVDQFGCDIISILKSLDNIFLIQFIRTHAPRVHAENSNQH